MKNRVITDIFIACADGFKGFPEAIEAVFPQMQGQFVPSASSPPLVSHKDRKAVADGLKEVYRAATVELYAGGADGRYQLKLTYIDYLRTSLFEPSLKAYDLFSHTPQELQPSSRCSAGAVESGNACKRCCPRPTGHGTNLCLAHVAIVV